MNGWDSILQTTTAFLVDEGKRGFPGAAHTLWFPAAQGFNVQQDSQTDAVFGRALIAEALAELRDGSSEIDALFGREVDWLLNARHPETPGGWKYFRRLRELPPDADDLGQILRVLLLAGREDDVRRCCEEPLDVLLRDGLHADGSFETWILPRDGRSPEQQAQAHWIDVAWGKGADPEVMANLLHALHCYDPVRFGDVIARGTAAIGARVEAGGSLRSTWYHGPYYGTFVAARLFAAVAPRSTAMEGMIGFTVDAMRRGAAWADPLSAALALLALGTVPYPTDEMLSCAEQGREVLADAVRSGAFAAAVPFIKMDLGRPTGIIHQTLTWSSGTITAAFVARAARRWSDLTFRSS